MFTHVDKNNQPCMVDVSPKIETRRFAHARTIVSMPDEVMQHLRQEENEIYSKKGPVFQTAIIAGVSALKQTANIIPFCHQLNIEGSKIDISIAENNEIVIDCTVKTYGKTGVEMEALTGAQVAALTIYDMCKALSHNIVIKQSRLIKKTGGKSDYK